MAIKHAISDLWKEAAALDTMPSPSLVALTVTVNTANHDVTTLQYLERYLSWADRKFLLAQFNPLAQDWLLEPTNLSTWWQQVESVVESLDISFMGMLSDPF